MTRKALPLYMYIMLIAAGCGTEPPATTGSYPLQLRIQLPVGLTEAATRRQRFESRVARAEIRLSSKRGASVVGQLAPGQWDSAGLAPIDFPKDPKDAVTVRVEIWDRTHEGKLRSYPVLTGRTEASAQELTPGGPNILSVRLSLKVSVHDYDL